MNNCFYSPDNTHRQSFRYSSTKIFSYYRILLFQLILTIIPIHHIRSQEIEKSSESVASRLQQGLQWHRTGSAKKAVRLGENLLKVIPPGDDTRLDLAGYFFQIEGYRQSEKILREMLQIFRGKKNKNELRTLIFENLFELQMAQKNYSQALKILNEAVAAKATNKLSSYNRVQVLIKLKDYSKARNAAKNGISEHPDFGLNYVAAAAIEYHVKESKQCRYYLEKAAFAVESNPASPWNSIILQKIQEIEKGFQTSLNPFASLPESRKMNLRKSQVENSTFSPLIKRLESAREAFISGDFAESIYEIEQLLKEENRFIQAENTLITQLQDLGLFAEAAEHARAIIKKGTGPVKPFILDNPTDELNLIQQTQVLSQKERWADQISLAHIHLITLYEKLNQQQLKQKHMNIMKTREIFSEEIKSCYKERVQDRAN